MDSLANYVIEEKKYGIQDVFDLIGEEYLTRNTDYHKRDVSISVDGFEVYPVSLRYMTFYQKGTTCVCCGKKGTHFKLCGDPNTNRRHFNLFADDGSLLTKDHILPKSKGGRDAVENMQTMCESCNNEKGNTYPGVTKKYVVATKIGTGKKSKFSNVEKAAIHIVQNTIRPPKKDKNAIIKASVSAVLKIQDALQCNGTYCGYYWTEEEE